jgi:Zn-dependent peptidase ImmA (M78 family)
VEKIANAFASELIVPMEQLKNPEKLTGMIQVSKPAMAIAIVNFFSSTRNFK